MLSTIGGAYSCVGDKGSRKHAKIAGKIAIGQLKLAYILGDDLLKLYALVYIAYSFLQRKLFVQCCTIAARIIRLYCDKNIFRGHDQRLENMLTYLWTRLRVRTEMSSRQGGSCTNSGHTYQQVAELTETQTDGIKSNTSESFDLLNEFVLSNSPREISN